MKWKGALNVKRPEGWLQRTLGDALAGVRSARSHLSSGASETGVGTVGSLLPPIDYRIHFHQALVGESGKLRV